MTRLNTSLFALAAVVGVSPTFAQTAPDDRPAPGDAIVVTASRSGEGAPARDLPASVTMLSAEQLDSRQTRIVSDVLRDVPGLAVSRTGGVGGLTQVRVRGTEANHVLVLIDGIEVSDPYQGEFDFGTLIADQGARIEVLRGQQSSLYGSDAIGGVIHYITASGREAPGMAARAEGGSFGTYAGVVRAGGASEAFDYALAGSLYGTRGTPTARGGVRDVGATGVGATAKINWTPSPAFTLTGVGRYSLSDAESNDTDGDFTSPGFGLTIDSPGVRLRNRGLYALARAALTLAGGRWTNALTGQVADTTRRTFDSDGLTSGNEGRRYKGSFESSYRLGDDRAAHRLTGAIDWEREEFRNTTPSPFAFQGRRATTNLGLVGQYELTIGDALSAGASVRHDRNDRFADATTWRVQAGYRLASGLRLRGAYGTGVKNPGYFELFGFSDGRYIGNPDLRPEKSRGWEAGVDYALADGRASLGATWFDSTLDGEIFTTFLPPTFVATPGNRTTRSRQRGVELFASARPVPQISFDLAYTYLRAREDRVREVRRPGHIASLNTTVTSIDRRFAGTLTARYTGRQDDLAFTDPSFIPVTESLQAFVLVNLAAEYRLSDTLALFGRVENLFDEDYEEIFSVATPGRGAFGGVKARF